MLAPVLGAGNVVCQVRADLNLDQVRTVDTSLYGGKAGHPQSIKGTTETYSGLGSIPGGQAGGLDVPNYSTSGSGDSEFREAR